MCLHLSPYPTRVQSYENKTHHMLTRTANDKLVRVCECIKILITKDKIQSSSNYNMPICSSL
jgi:hypothetical protein